MATETKTEWAKPDYYHGPEAGDFSAEPEPFGLFETWFAQARKFEINDANAMALATVDQNGLPNVRIVLLKGLDDATTPERGFVFYTNYEGAKGRELLASRKCALNFHWKGLRRQVRVRGTVGLVSSAEADAYYASRPRGSRISAWASAQSRPIDSRAALEQEVARCEAKFGDGEIPRPPHWSGFRVTPLEIEFWHDRPFRLHERIVFRREHSGGEWSKARLNP